MDPRRPPEAAERGDASGLYIGLMSGTSADGIDAVLASLDQHGARVVHALCAPFSAELKQALDAVISRNEAVTLKQLGELDRALALAFADAALLLLRQSGTRASDVAAIGCHGQTIYHSPDGDRPFTWQMGDPSLVAAHSGVLTVADFRRKDLALGGQGAPLVPAFHAALFGRPGTRRAVLNVGGIANLTLLEGRRCVGGFDTGPGNCLLDAWCQRQRGEPFDRDGAWAASGSSDPALLESFLDHPFILRRPPKSTGREIFNLAWLEGLLQTQSHRVAARDVQASLLEFTARAVERALQAHFPAPETLAVCGGGAHNLALLERLTGLLPQTRVCTTDELGLAADWVEGAAFAWLARQCLAGKPGNLPSVTGARRPAVLGGIYHP